MLGQVHHFLHYAPERVPYGIERYGKEAKRIYGVMDKHLENHLYFADEYSIADMSIFPWVRFYERQEVNIDDYPNVKRWFYAVNERPAVQAGLSLI